MLDIGSDGDGWTACEALKRVPNAAMHLRSGDLLAWGRVGDTEANASYIAAPRWLDSSLRTATKGRIEGVLRDGLPVFDLRIFPVLEAPNLSDYLGHLPLKEVVN